MQIMLPQTFYQLILPKLYLRNYYRQELPLIRNVNVFRWNANLALKACEKYEFRAHFSFNFSAIKTEWIDQNDHLQSTGREGIPSNNPENI